jgi:hypothetical protein
MTQLSPQAQAVLDAHQSTSVRPVATAQIAAALQEVAQLLAYEVYCESWYELVIDANDLYAIAAELEQSNS